MSISINHGNGTETLSTAVIPPVYPVIQESTHNKHALTHLQWDVYLPWVKEEVWTYHLTHLSERLPAWTLYSSLPTLAPRSWPARTCSLSRLLPSPNSGMPCLVYDDEQPGERERVCVDVQHSQNITKTLNILENTHFCTYLLPGVWQEQTACACCDADISLHTRMHANYVGFNQNQNRLYYTNV